MPQDDAAAFEFRYKLQIFAVATPRLAVAKASGSDCSMLVHSVYFWLKPELTAEQRAAFRKGVESLGGIKSLAGFHVGSPAGTERRPVIDSSYDVALVTIFKDLAAHDTYQVDPIHLAFIETCRQYWAKFQVYDSE